jgi:hypothetical protein
MSQRREPITRARAAVARGQALRAEATRLVAELAETVCRSVELRALVGEEIARWQMTRRAAEM